MSPILVAITENINAFSSPGAPKLPNLIFSPKVTSFLLLFCVTLPLSNNTAFLYCWIY